MHLIRGILICSSLISSSTATVSASITNVVVTNTSSPNESLPTASFETQSTLFPITNSGVTSSFGHRMGFHNEYTADGGPAQVHKRNVIYQIDFTIEDPNNFGFTLEAVSGLIGRSSVTSTSAGTGNVTGASFYVSIDDSTDAPNTFSPFTPLFNQTSGTSASDFASSSVLGDQFVSATVGSFVGTTSFSFEFSTVPTPTTNVFFGNNHLGFGSVDYLTSGLFGHHLTFTATFNVPEPGAGCLLLFAANLWLTVRWRR